MTPPLDSPGSFPDFLRAFVDDAAIFPPASTDLGLAVAEHEAHRASEYAELVGGFVVSDVEVADLGALRSRILAERNAVVEERGASVSRPFAPLQINLLVTGGAGAIAPAVTWLGRADGVTLAAVEFALRDEDDLAHNARRLIHVVDSLEEELEDVAVYAEPPMLRGQPTHGWLSALDELSAREVLLKFRTGGPTEDHVPSAPDLASCIESALDRELPFKCTAGLHHAVRNRDATTGFAHHGFLNVLLATRSSLDGHGLEEVVATLDDTDGPALAERLRTDPGTAARTRRWFRSFGSCSVLEAHEDLVELGLLP